MFLICRKRCCPRFSRLEAYMFAFGIIFGFYMITWVNISVNIHNVASCPRYNPYLPTKTSERLYLDKPKNNFMLVAVMTARKYLDTRARALYETWGNKIPGSIVFFVGGQESYHGDLPVVVLKDVDELTYPPQKKCFRMIQYITSHFINDFEWFMRADDDVFVKPDRLEQFLRTVNSSKPLYMGQPGMGVKEEAGKLGLDNAPYCMGGPGVYFTKSTLERIKFHVDDCIDSPATLHEDTELGRCVYLYASVSCTNSYEFSKLFMMNYKNKSGSFVHELGEPEARAITLHPIKQSPHMYRLQNHFTAKRIQTLRIRLQNISEEVSMLDRLINKEVIPTKGQWEDARERLAEFDGWTLGNPNHGGDGLQSNERSEPEEWGFIKRNKYYSRHNLHQHPEAGIGPSYKSVAQADAIATVNSYKEFSLKDMKASLYGYQRLSHGRIMENVVIKEYKKQSTLSVRTRQHFVGMDMADMSRELPTKIWMVLPLYQRANIYTTFLLNLMKAMKKFEGELNLHVVLYADEEDGEYKVIQHNTEIMKRKQSRVEVQITTFYNEPFSRAKAITAGVENLSPDSLIVIMDVDMAFTDKYLSRVLRNTVMGKQAWFPIYFSQFDPESVCYEVENCNLENFDVANKFGFWRYFSYGIVSIFKFDFLRVNGFLLDIKGWGKEDVDFFEKILKSPTTAFRCPDPSIMHIYHLRFCDPQLPPDQYVMCETSRNKMYGYDGTLYHMADTMNLIEQLPDS